MSPQPTQVKGRILASHEIPSAAELEQQRANAEEVAVVASIPEDIELPALSGVIDRHPFTVPTNKQHPGYQRAVAMHTALGELVQRIRAANYVKLPVPTHAEAVELAMYFMAFLGPQPERAHVDRLRQVFSDMVDGMLRYGTDATGEWEGWLFPERIHRYLMRWTHAVPNTDEDPQQSHALMCLVEAHAAQVERVRITERELVDEDPLAIFRVVPAEATPEPAPRNINEWAEYVLTLPEVQATGKFTHAGHVLAYFTQVMVNHGPKLGYAWMSNGLRRMDMYERMLSDTSCTQVVLWGIEQKIPLIAGIINGKKRRTMADEQPEDAKKIERDELRLSKQLP